MEMCAIKIITMNFYDKILSKGSKGIWSKGTVLLGHYLSHNNSYVSSLTKL